LLEAAPDALVIVTSDGRIVFVNSLAETMFGYARSELIGQSIEMLMPERFRASHTGQRTRFFAQRKARSLGSKIDLVGLRKDGSEFPADISLSPMQTEEGVLVCSAIRDITERKDIERALANANRHKSEFLANMSHELRTPLNAIIGFAELMYRGKVGPVSSEHQEYLGDILASSRQLLQLINDVLDLAKVESGKMEFLAEPFEPATVVSEVLEIVRGLAAEKHIQIESQVDAGLTRVVLDANKLKLVLFNYISNAIKFTPEEGRVTVRVAPEGSSRFRIEVEDNGIGIKSDDLPKLFTEFQQLDSSTAKRHPGTGLGLALTKRVVEAQGGTVGVTSAPGKGSTFFAVLPRECGGLGAYPTRADARQAS
jgi:PAS domain S-box-containing protein